MVSTASEYPIQVPEDRISLRIDLEEQRLQRIQLSMGEAGELSDLCFDVFPAGVASSGGDLADEQLLPGPLHFLFDVNPREKLGHFRLRSSERVVCIKPKVPIRNVFQLLAASYSAYRRNPPFRQETVAYDEDAAEFLEPVIEEFCVLVEKLLQDGLLKRYVERRESLSYIKGSIDFSEHLRSNLVDRTKISCRFARAEVDIPENQVILWALVLLRRERALAPELRGVIQSLILRCAGISLREFRSRQFPRFEYDRLSRRYQEIHGWCQLFIDLLSLSDRPGERDFAGYLLDMNVLFERFVTVLFERSAESVSAVAVKSKMRSFFDLDRISQIEPDIVIQRQGASVTMIDAKYKRTPGDRATNPDLYQIVAYCLTHGLVSVGRVMAPRGVLIYPEHERGDLSKSLLRIKTASHNESNLWVELVWIDLADSGLIGTTLDTFESLLRRSSA